jgi:catalase
VRSFFTSLGVHFHAYELARITKRKLMESNKALTSDGGAPVADNQNWRTAGPARPVLIEDHHSQEVSRIPDRIIEE